MSTTLKVHVSTSVLRWALERLERLNRFSEIEAIQKRFPKIHQWLSEQDAPTMRQLEALAKATYTPLGYFFLSRPPEERLPIPHFRTRDRFVAQFSPELLETVYTMKRRQAWLRDYLIEQGQEPLPFVGSAKYTDDSRRVAQLIKSTLALEEGWSSDQPTWTAAIRALHTRIENIGIVVVINSIVGNNTRRKLDPLEFRGFVLVDEYAPLMFINGADSKAAQMFTLAHELAHVWFGASAIFDLQELQPADDDIEQACNRVAAEFLMPEEELRSAWPDACQEPEPFQALAKQFKVSELVAARRALDLGFITKDRFFDFYRSYQQKERLGTPKTREGGDFYATQNLRIGRRFAEAVVRAVREGKLLYREAYQLTGLYGKTFERYAKSLGLGGTP